MAEETAEVQEAAPVEVVDKFAAAGAALTEELGGDGVLELASDDTPVPVEAVADVDGDDPGLSEEGEENGGKPKEENPPGWRFKRLREKEEKVKTALSEARSAQEEATALKASIERLSEQMASNPIEAVYALAERAGIDKSKLIEHIARGAVSQGIDSPEMQEIKRLRAELAEKDSAKEKAKEKKKAEQESEVRASYVKNCAEQARAIKSNPELSGRFKHLAALSEDQIVGRVTYAANWALDNNPNVKLSELVETLDGLAKQELEEAAKALGWNSVGTQATSKPAAEGSKTPSLSNRDHGSSGAPIKSSIDMTPQERQALAARLL